jgi:CubicO group peptidase (beta-lactamase class C family)
MVNIEKVERLIASELMGRSHPGSSVSIIKDNEVLWSKGFGYSDIRSGKQATPDTIYGCASVTKPIVTVGFLQIMERGKFNLDDEVNTHLDVKVKDVKGDEPKIRDLLTHYTGMPTRVPPIHLLGEPPTDAREYIAEAARMVRRRGEAWAYCNTSFTIVGHLMHQFTGIAYDEYLRRRVLKPLEMTSSDFALTPAVTARLAQGYKRAGGPDKPLIPSPPYFLGMRPADPAGSLYSTVLDLAKFVIMNLNNGVYKGKRLLKEDTIKEMQRLQAPTGKSNSGMGLTWFRTIHDDRVMLYHTGGLPDFTNKVCFYPDEGLGVCWLSNLQDGSEWRPPASTILRIAACGETKTKLKSQSPPANWDKIVGVYGDEITSSTIRVTNGQLTLDDALVLERIEDTRYRVHGSKYDGEELTLEYGDDGYVKQLDLGTTYYRRYQPETPKVDLGADLVGTWIGEYNDPHGFHLIELRIHSRDRATVNGPTGEYISLSDFRAELGQVSGQGIFRIPPEYARWDTSDYVDVKFDLKAIDKKLLGLLTSPNGVNKIELTKK